MSSRPCPIMEKGNCEAEFYYDFTGTVFDTKSECQAVGFLFSDDDTPFPDSLYADLSGSWTHDTGVGWKAACTEDSKGPSIIYPLVRSHDWELEITFDFTAAAVTEMCRLILGTMTPNNDYGAVAFAQDNNNAATELAWYLYTNDGDDSVTVRFQGDPLAGTGERVIKLRQKNGCISVYDDEDDVWEDYTGRQAAGIAYTPSHLFIQVQKIGAATLSDITIKKFKLTYS